MSFLDLFRRPQTRAEYARTNADLLVNDPDGFPSAFPPVWWLGIDTGGGQYPIGPNGPNTAKAIPAVIRATALITGPLTAAPFRVVESDTGGRVLGRPRWVTDPMLLRPDDRYSPQEHPDVGQLPRGQFWATWVRNALWWGLGAFVYVEDASGQPMAGTCRIVDPAALSTERDENGALCWVLGDATGPRARFTRDGLLRVGTITYRISVLRNPHSPVDSEGMSRGVFALAPSAFRLADDVSNYTAGQFRNGVPNGFLKVTAPDLSSEEAAALKKTWLDAHGGDRRSIAVLNATTDFQAINLSPVDAELADVKRLNIADVAFAFGLDPTTLGAALNGSGTYTNLQDAWANHRDFGLAPWVTAIQDTLSPLLPGAQAISVALDAFANPTPTERFTAYKVALDAKIYTLEEVRAMEGLAPLPEGGNTNE